MHLSLITLRCLPCNAHHFGPVLSIQPRDVGGIVKRGNAVCLAMTSGGGLQVLKNILSACSHPVSVKAVHASSVQQCLVSPSFSVIPPSSLSIYITELNAEGPMDTNATAMQQFGGLWAFRTCRKAKGSSYREGLEGFASRPLIGIGGEPAPSLGLDGAHQEL